MAKINVSLEGYYDVAVNAGTLSQLAEQIKEQYLILKNNERMQDVIDGCDLEGDVESGERLLEDIIFRTNRMYEVTSYAYNVYSEVEHREKDIVLEAVSIQTEDIELDIPDDSDSDSSGWKTGSDISSGVSKVFSGIDTILDLCTKTDWVSHGLKFTTKQAYTIVSGAIREIGCGTRYLTKTLKDGTDAVSNIFNKVKTIEKVSKGFSIAGDLFGIAGTSLSWVDKHQDIWDDSELTEREKNIQSWGLGIASTIGIGLNVASIVCTATGVGAPVGLALAAIETIVTSDSGIAGVTSVVESTVEACEQIKDSVAKAYETGTVDMEAIGNNLTNAVGDAVQTGVGIVTNAWEQLKESDGVLDTIGNAVNLVCAPVVAVKTTVVNTAIAAGTAVVNTVASAGAAVVKWFKKW